MRIQALTKLSNAQKDLATSEAERMNKEEEVRNLERKVIDAEQEKSLIEEKARGAACNVDDLQGQLAQRQVDIEILKKVSFEKRFIIMNKEIRRMRRCHYDERQTEREKSILKCMAYVWSISLPPSPSLIQPLLPFPLQLTMMHI